jgi:hypothetical protein
MGGEVTMFERLEKVCYKFLPHSNITVAFDSMI